MLGIGILELRPNLVVQSWCEVEETVANVQRANNANSAHKTMIAMLLEKSAEGFHKLIFKQRDSDKRKREDVSLFNDLLFDWDLDLLALTMHQKSAQKETAKSSQSSEEKIEK